MANQNITTNMCEETSLFKYLCPSLLSEKYILEELKRNCSKIKGLERKTRDELTQIFLRHLMPLPQRTFPNNNHGKLINKMIQKENASKHTGKTEKKHTTLQFGFSENKQVSKPSVTLGSSLSGDRLKPPIDSAEVQSKKISLTKTPASSANSCLEKVIIKDRMKERKQSTDSDSQSHSSTDGAVEAKKVELKRSHSSSEAEDCSPSKKSRQRIAWP